MNKYTFATIIIIAVSMPHSLWAMTVSPPRMEIFADPGENIELSIKLLNETADEVVLYSSTLNFTADEKQEGVPKFYDLPSADSSLANWIKIDKGPISISSGQVKEINFNIDVPQNADPGGHYAAIFFGTEPPGGSSGSGIGISGKVGTLLLLNISGDVLEAGKITEFKTQETTLFYDSLPVKFVVNFQNSGNVHLKPQGEIIITNLFGYEAGRLLINEEGVSGARNVLPQSSRHFEAEWPSGWIKDYGNNFAGKLGSQWHNFAIGRYSASVELKYGSSSGSKTTGALFFWVFPWQIMLAGLLSAVLAVLLLAVSVKKYNKWVVKRALSKKS